MTLQKRLRGIRGRSVFLVREVSFADEFLKTGLCVEVLMC